MKGLYSRALALGLFGAAVAATAPDVSALGWPENYEGVMLQGFYWDSYKDTAWTNLESQADELSKYFKLIWIPNSGKCSYMGYMPQYWFTNHNSAFGSEQELLSMISTYKAKGTGFIADCVINHRNGVTGWYDFPVEKWNGQTWSIGLDGICRNDEMYWNEDQPNPTGNYDTGENFDGCRDLDHTNANVQDNCKNYVKCLKEKYGYIGMRYDMVKGYGGQYNKIYNTYADVEYSVGEYWDGYDAIAAWIEATGKTSAAFDFPCKYALNEAFSTGDMTKLVWKENGVNDQPAGMIHHWYQRYAVTFVDNHDTYRDGSKYTGNVIAANAFILMSPGTPCVFLPHYQAYKEEIQRLIDIRNSAGIHNQSSVKVLRSTSDCYMAEVDGKRGKVVVKVGGAMASPAGYSDSDIKAAGSDYCVWTKVNVGGGDDPVPTPAVPDHLYLMGNLDGAQWSTSASPEMKKDGGKFTISATFAVAPGEKYAYFNFCDALAEDWEPLNATANRYGAPEEGTVIADNTTVKIQKHERGISASKVQSWKILPGTYTLTVDFSDMSLTVGERGEIETDPMPAHFYIIGHADGNDWASDKGVEMEISGDCFVAKVDLVPPVASDTRAGKANAYFSFTKSLSDTWDGLNIAGNRYAPEVDTELTPDGRPVELKASANPAEAKAYNVVPGRYDVEVNWKDKTIRLRSAIESGIGSIDVSGEKAAYYNLQGVRVVSPKKGEIYICVKGNKAWKVVY
ncbi:MAG: hypothetical protein K2J70_04040 [Muribaculaceae bacterium]|nr:hypothetical protein [Muribaculaceae bacterium]